MKPTLEELLKAHGHAETAGAQECFQAGREFEQAGDLHAAATAYDRAYGLNPSDAQIAELRLRLLNQLSIAENGVQFRYIPAGTFLMGSETGEPDEAPVHPVRLEAYWMSETPVSWETFCALAGWSPPPDGMPPEARQLQSQRQSPGGLSKLLQRLTGKTKPTTPPNRERLLSIAMDNRIRLQYCEDDTTRAMDWHAHTPNVQWRDGEKTIPASELFGQVPRNHPERPWGYREKPMVSMTWKEAALFCGNLSSAQALYTLPTEAEWEKAARGGLIGCAYPWGDQPPSSANCDFERFDQYSIRPSRSFAPNGYGLYAMSGGVWEWTLDWYDAAYYATSPAANPTGPARGEERVLRGGSWADCAEAVTVSFRMARKDGLFSCGMPNVGFRLCRKQSAASAEQ